MITVRSRRVLALALLACASAPTAKSSTASPKPPGPSWSSKVAPLMTPWASDVSPENAHPEYPRPQMVRGRWLNLNGVWQFANATADQAPPFGQTLAEAILVPFPVESALSGIMRDGPVHMWYRRTFIVPSDWAGQRVLLNFGAVDWEATVYVNHVNVGTHRGGYSGFSFDITSQLNGGTNELIVGVFDPTDAGNQPVGKQRRSPRSIWYAAGRVLYPGQGRSSGARSPGQHRPAPRTGHRPRSQPA